MTSNKGTYFYDVIPIQFDDTERANILEQFPVPDLANGDYHFDIEQEVKGNRVRFIAILNDYSIERTKTDKEFLKMRFSNNLGSFSTKMWDNQGAVAQNSPLLEEHSVFQLEGTVDEFGGYKSITLDRLNPCQDEIDPFSLLASTKENLEDLTVELVSYLRELEEPYQQLAFALLEKSWKSFRVSPAAKGFHHNYLGGLLFHTVGLMRFLRYMMKTEKNHYEAVLKLINVVEKALKKEMWNDLQSDSPGKNPRNIIWKDTLDHLYNMYYGMVKYKDEVPSYELALVSILAHDIGKGQEYHHAGRSMDDFKWLYPNAEMTQLEEMKPTGITMCPIGSLIGHIPIALLMVNKIIELENIQLPIVDIHKMMNIIGSHHGKQEWGSSVDCKTVESHLVHICDFLDSRYEMTKK